MNNNCRLLISKDIRTMKDLTPTFPHNERPDPYFSYFLDPYFLTPTFSDPSFFFDFQDISCGLPISPTTVIAHLKTVPTELPFENATVVMVCRMNRQWSYIGSKKNSIPSGLSEKTCISELGSSAWPARPIFQVSDPFSAKKSINTRTLAAF